MLGAAFWLLACLWAALAGMPHLHSPAARLRRRERAVRRGYLAPGAGHDCKFVAVAAAVAPRIRQMARSVELHLAHEQLAGRTFHYARTATGAVAERLSPDEARAAFRAHSLANQAKHSTGPAKRSSGLAWADVSDSASVPECW